MSNVPTCDEWPENVFEVYQLRTTPTEYVRSTAAALRATTAINDCAPAAVPLPKWNSNTFTARIAFSVQTGGSFRNFRSLLKIVILKIQKVNGKTMYLTFECLTLQEPWSLICAYAPHTGCTEEDKDESAGANNPRKVIIAVDLSSHVGTNGEGLGRCGGKGWRCLFLDNDA